MFRRCGLRGLEGMRAGLWVGGEVRLRRWCGRHDGVGVGAVVVVLRLVVDGLDGILVEGESKAWFGDEGGFIVDRDLCRR